MKKNLLLAGAAFILFGTAAHAADIIEPTAYDWTGPYIGLQGGYGWGESDVEGQGESESPSPGLNALVDSDPVEPPNNSGSIGLEGFVGGAHAGYNWQMDSLVLGFEGDIEFSDMSGDTDTPYGKIKQDIDWLGSLRLRAGFAADRALIYATGGLAVGGVDMRITDEDFGSNDDTKTAWGWTVGGGIEYAFTDELSGLIEYRYTDLDDTDIDSTTPEIGTSVEFANTFHAVRAGLSWRFSGL